MKQPSLEPLSLEELEAVTGGGNGWKATPKKTPAPRNKQGKRPG